MSGELIFVGLGLGRGDLTVKAVSILKKSDIIFCETYTSEPSDYTIEELEDLIGKRIEFLERKDVEEGEILIEKATENRVALLVLGDPMVATTHVSLRIEAEKRGIKTKIINGISVITVIPSLLGLQHYKFGRITTLAYPEDGYFPLSPYYVIKENFDRGLHTLVLLDINREKNRLMTIKEGLDILLEMESRIGGNLINEDLLVCGVARAGSENCIFRAGPLKIIRNVYFGETPHSIVIPGHLHFIEEEALSIFAGYRKMR